MALSPEQEKYYNDLGEMFGTAGWRNLVEEIKAEIYQIQADALEAPTWEQVNFLRGRAEQLAYFARLEEVSDMQRQLLMDAEE